MHDPYLALTIHALDVLESARWFSCLDLTSGYWQVEVAPEDCEKTACACYSIWSTSVPCHAFWSNSAPATFQRLMERVQDSTGPHVLSTWMIS